MQRFRIVCLGIFVLWAALRAPAQTVTSTITAGTGPVAVAVNPVTNKIYVANQSSNNVTVIDGATNSTTTITVGSAPKAIAVNTVTNRV